MFYTPPRIFPRMLQRQQRIARGWRRRRRAWRFPAVAARIASTRVSGSLAGRAFGVGQEMPQRRRHKPGGERLSRDARRSRGSGRERHGALGGRQNPSGEARPARALSTLAPPQQHGGRPGDAPGMPRRKQHRPQRMQCECMPQTVATLKPTVWTPRAASVRVPAVRASRGVCPGRAPAPAAGPRALPRARSARARLNERDTHRGPGRRVVRVDNMLGGFTHCQCVAALRTFPRLGSRRRGDFSDQPACVRSWQLSRMFTTCLLRGARALSARLCSHSPAVSAL